MSHADAIAYFTKKELACNCCGIVKLDMNLAVHLPIIRHQWGEAMTLNSVCRCPKRNTEEGGHPRSMHLTENPRWATDGSCAADVAWRHWDSEKKLKFARFAWKLGWSVGLHDGFCHIDRRADIGLKQTVYIYEGKWSAPFEATDVIE